MDEDVGIQQFYTDKCVLVTGATGFIGKVLVEKLLRTCPKIKMIFLLVRAKKGKDSQQRIDDLFNELVFGPMKEENPYYKDKVTLIVGDVTLPDLGISEADKKKLIDQVNIVFHGAATVKFDETLKRAVQINVTGTEQVLNLCTELRNLKVLVHISTAYANCNKMEISEVVYEPPIKSDDLIKITNCISEDVLEKCCGLLIYDWPNTYTFTKQVAEDLVRSKCTSKGIPFAILRPGIVIGACKEPIRGWVDNIYGVTGIIAALGAGIMRSMHVDLSLKADLIPVDITVNTALAIAWDVACNKKDNAISNDSVPVYNCTASKTNSLKWGDLLKQLTNSGFAKPPIRVISYYGGVSTKHLGLFYIYNFFLHIIPALIVDSVLWMTPQQPIATKIYRKLQKFLLIIGYFATKQWNFHNDKMKKLSYKLNEEDKNLFNFDVDEINWMEYLEDYIDAIRLYIFHDTPDTIPAAKKRLFVLGIFYRAVQIIFFWIIYLIFRTPISIFIKWILQKSYVNDWQRY